MTIYEKLASIQLNLNAPKNQYNKFGKYNYRSCEDILEALKPCLREVKAIVTISDEIVHVGDRYYVKATAILHDTEGDGVISNTAYARESEEKKGMDVSQVTGATSSYARKYALNGLFCIDDVKDADTRDNRQKEAEQQKEFENNTKEIAKATISAEKIKALRKTFIENGIAETKVLELYKIKSLEETTEKQHAHMISKLERLKEECGV